MQRQLPEQDELLRIVDKVRPAVDVRTLCEVSSDGQRFPIYAICMGSRSPAAPALGFFGGVHGLERVGTHVLLSFLESLLAELERDETLQELVSQVRLIFVPLVNPAGMARRTRSNANGVDLMRNAPLDSPERVAFLLGGHRLSRRMPWYRGPERAPMETESRALCDLVREEMLSRPFSLALDCHSGFGLRDRIWFPHAHTRKPFAHMAEVHALMARFSAAHPDHFYLFEPQSRRYLTHGDLWDYLYRDERRDGHAFLPLTLEMGSWRWIRKSPRQIWSLAGLFNPLPAERLLRVRRNHLPWFYFLCRAAQSHRQWLPVGQAREEHERSGLARWFA